MSTTVDSKVVELQFLNKDFEQNATQSISTIEKLKKSLDFTDATTGLEDINSNIKAVNFNNLTNGIKEATNGFSMMETIAFGVFNRLGAKIADFAVDSIGKIFTFVPKQIWTGGKSRSFNMEQAKFQIEGLEKEWDDIKDDIDYAVSGTAFGMDVAAKAASQLLASGVEFGEVFGETGNSPMAKALRGISGVAAMTGTSYEEISRIFTTVAGQGRAMAGELNRIAERGLNGSKAIADFMNNLDHRLDNASESVQKEVQEITGGMEVTEADIRELASKGAISFDIFSEAMDAAFGEHATKANDTFAGTVSNIKAQLSKLGEVFVSPAMTAAIPFLNNIYEIIKRLRTIIAGTSENPTAFMKGYLAMVNGITGGLEAITGAVKALLNGEDFDFIGAIKKAFGFGEVEEVADETADKVAGSFTTIRDAAFKAIKGDYGNGMERIQKLTEEGFDAETVQKYVNALWKVSGHDWSKIFDTDIQKQAWSMADLGDATADYVENGQDLVKQQREEQKSIREMAQEMSKSERVMLGVINIWTGLVAAFESVKAAFKENIKIPKIDVLDIITTKFLEISAAFNDFTTKHADDIAAVFSGIVNAVLLVVGVLKTFLSVALTVLGIALIPILAIVGGLILAITKAATAIRNWVVENKIFEQITSKVSSTLNNAKAKIEGWWKAFKEFPAVKKAIDTFKTAFSDAFVKAPYYLNQAKNAVLRFGGRAKNAFKQLWNKKISPAEFFTQMKQAWSGFTKTVSSFQFVQNIKNAIESGKAALDEWFTSLGTNEDGTLNAFGKIYSAVKNVGSVLSSAWTSVKEFIAGLDPIGFIGDKITAASEKFTELKESFLSFPGMTDTLTKFKEGAKSAFENIPNFVSGAITHFGGFFKQVGSGFMKLIHGEYTPEQFLNSTKLAFDNVVRFFTNFHGFDEFKASIKSAVDTIGGWIDSLGTNADGSRNAFGKFLDKLKEIRDWIVEKLGVAKEKLLGFFGGLDLGPAGLLNKFKIIKQGIKKFVEGIPEWFSGLGGAFGDFFKRLTNLDENGALNFDNIMFVFSDTVGKYLETHDIFAPIKAAFKLLFEDLKTSAKESFPEVFDIFDKVRTFFKDFSLPKALKLLPKIFGGLWKALSHNFSKKFEDIGNSIGDIGTFITDHLKDFLTIDTSKLIGLFVGFMVLRKVLNELTAFNESRAEAGSFGDSMLKLAGAIAIIAIVMAALTKFEWGDFLSSAGKLAILIGLLLGAMAAMLAIGKFLGGGDDSLTVATGAMMQLVVAIGALALIMAALTKFKWPDFMSSVGKIVILAGILLLAMLALSAIGPVGMLGATAALELAGSIALIIFALNTAANTDMEAAGRNLAQGFKAFCEEIEGLEVSPEALEAVQAVTSALTGPGWSAMFGAMGECVANILPGTGEDQTLMQRFQASADTLADTVNNWSEKMAGIKPNHGANTAVNLISAAVRNCNASGMWGALNDFVGNVFGGDISNADGSTTAKPTSMQRFENAASVLSSTVTSWTETMNGITVDESALSGVLDLKDVLDQVSAAGLDVAIDSFWGNWLSDGEDKTTPERFKEGVAAMADSLRAWNDGMNGKDGEDPVGDIVDPPTEGIRKLSDALKEIPDMGLADHITDFIAGGYPDDTEIQTFGTNLTSLAEVIKAWNEGMVDENGNPIVVTDVDVNAIQNLADGLSKIPSDSIFSKIGDWFTKTNKEDEAKAFKENLKTLGEAINNYVTGLSGTSEEDISKATKILRAMAVFSDALRMMDLGGLDGKSDIGKFSKLIKDDLATAIDDFITKTSEVDGFDAVIDGLKSITSLADISLTEGDITDPTKVQTFTENVKSIINSLSEAAMKAFLVGPGLERLKEGMDTINSISAGDTGSKEAGNAAGSDMAEGLEESKSKITNSAKGAMSGAMSAIKASAKDYHAAGVGLMTRLATGMRSAAKSVKNSAQNLAGQGATAARKKYSDFRSAGAYLAQGFSQGITNTIFKVRLTAEAMAKAALEKARQVLKVSSPSREAYKIGDFFGQGFAKGISDYSSTVGDTAASMANEARKGLARAVDAINSMVADDMNATPVIRPVLDLSEIQNGASSISGLLNTSPSVALAGNLGAINASFTNRTDPNAAILSALDSLKATISESPRSTNIINGVTYDDGSNITSAVETLVHAALVERRV